MFAATGPAALSKSIAAPPFKPRGELQPLRVPFDEVIKINVRDTAFPNGRVFRDAAMLFCILSVSVLFVAEFPLFFFLLFCLKYGTNLVRWATVKTVYTDIDC